MLSAAQPPPHGPLAAAAVRPRTRRN